MKLLLTSQGFYNESIKKAFYEMLEKPIEETNLIFVTTAANCRFGDKRWIIALLNQIAGMGLKTIDILDFSGLPEELWGPRFEEADVIFFAGGNTYHLMYEIKKSGLYTVIKNLLRTKVFVGNSAGSIIATKNLSLGNPKHLEYCESRVDELTNETLGLVNFLVRPHYNLPGHPSSESEVREMMNRNNVIEDVYLIDDNTAIKVIDDTIEVISEGEWKLLQ
jgi:dipeptidase E